MPLPDFLTAPSPNTIPGSEVLPLQPTQGTPMKPTLHNQAQLDGALDNIIVGLASSICDLHPDGIIIKLRRTPGLEGEIEAAAQKTLLDALRLVALEQERREIQAKLTQAEAKLRVAQDEIAAYRARLGLGASLDVSA